MALHTIVSFWLLTSVIVVLDFIRVTWHQARDSLCRMHHNVKCYFSDADLSLWTHVLQLQDVVCRKHYLC